MRYEISSLIRTDLYNLADSYTIDNIRSQNIYNIQLSKSTNPYYFASPFSGLIVAPAGHYFIINFMSNHSADNPGGYLDKAQLKSFFGVSGPDNALVGNKGQEQIPQNWYRRPSSNPYDIPAAAADIVIGQLMSPGTSVVGGNTGTTNSFVGIDLGSLTGGAYNSANLLEGNNLACFAFQALQNGFPDVLSPLFSNIAPVLQLINDVLAPILSNLSCPTLEIYNRGLFDQFPGSKYNLTGSDTSY